MAIRVIETSALQDFAPSGPLMMPLVEAGQGRVLLLNLEAGQSVAPCQMSVTVLYYVIAGRGQLHVGDGQSELRDGSLAVVPAGVVRSISARQRMRVLAVQIP